MNEHTEIIADKASGGETPRPGAPQPETPKIWGFWATLAWGLGAFAVLAAGQFGALLFVLALEQRKNPHERIDVAALGNNGPLVATVTIVSVPLLIAFLAFAVRRSRTAFRDYLALYWPDTRRVVIGFIGLAAVLALESLSATLSGQNTPTFMTDTYATGRAAGLLPLLALAFAVAAPIGEEALFRGFLYRGFAERLGAPAAILLTAVAWAMMHVQYDAFFIGQILVLGLYLGWVRWRCGSTLLTMALHATVNSVALLGLAFGGGR